MVTQKCPDEPASNPATALPSCPISGLPLEFLRAQTSQVHPEMALPSHRVDQVPDVGAAAPQAAAPVPAGPSLAALHKELNRITWEGEDEGWNHAIAAVQRRIAELLAASPVPLSEQPSEAQAERAAVLDTLEKRLRYIRDFGDERLIESVRTGQIPIHKAIAQIEAARVAAPVSQPAEQPHMAGAARQGGSTIDTLAFEEAILAWAESRETAILYPKPMDEAWAALITHIDAHTASREQAAAAKARDAGRKEAWQAVAALPCSQDNRPHLLRAIEAIRALTDTPAEKGGDQ